MGLGPSEKHIRVYIIAHLRGERKTMVFKRNKITNAL